MTSNIRKQILTALQAQDGLTREEIASLIYPNGRSSVEDQSISMSLSWMRRQGVIREVTAGREWRFFLEEPPEAHEVSAPPDRGMQPNGERYALSPLQRKRKGINVAIFERVTRYDDVMQLWIFRGGAGFPYPLRGDNLRIQTGSIPEWSEWQETTKGVTCVKIVYASGETKEYRFNPDEFFTIDAE